MDWNVLDDDFTVNIPEVDESVSPDTYRILMTMHKTPDFHVFKALGKVTAAEVVHAVVVVRSEA